MANLRSDFISRVARLPKPNTIPHSLMPLFEAVSNSIHSTKEKYGDRVKESGKIIIDINHNNESFSATITDNGIGLDKDNYHAFCTLDTDHKKKIGGKGIGRISWLDCFESIDIQSVYLTDNSLRIKKFKFVLSNENQIKDEEDKETSGEETGVIISFKGLKGKYRDKFPMSFEDIFQHFSSHFITTFVQDNVPNIVLHFNKETAVFPKYIEKNIIERREFQSLKSSFGRDFSLQLFRCKAETSTNFSSANHMHFIANERTVLSQSLDNRLGFGAFGENENEVLHGIITGSYLDENVNQDRTMFMFGKETKHKIINDVCIEKINFFIEDAVKKHREKQKGFIIDIIQSSPSYGFASLDYLLEKVPNDANNKEGVYKALSVEKFRVDKKQREKIEEVLKTLNNSKFNIEFLKEEVSSLSKSVSESETRSLAEYVVHRKSILKILKTILMRVKQRNDGEFTYVDERFLHDIICPRKSNSLFNIQGTSEKAEAVSHNLWVIDERMTYSKYFCSDIETKKITQAAGDKTRADVVVFDSVYGLSYNGNNSEILLAEFKKPGRTKYEMSVIKQINKYIKNIIDGKAIDINGRPIVVDRNSVKFRCYIIADIIGDLLEEVDTLWMTTLNGRGRYTPLSGIAKGSIEIIGWDDLLQDAEERNKIFFEHLNIAT
ncbi:ATP-binding protein [Liberibacter crescens]|nr:ATP-binding protein [Liberibacter crescens]